MGNFNRTLSLIYATLFAKSSLPGSVFSLVFPIRNFAFRFSNEGGEWVTSCSVWKLVSNKSSPSSKFHLKMEFSRKSSTGSAFQRLFISSWLYFNRFSNISLYHNLRNISQHWHIKSKIPHMLIVWVYQDWVWIKPSQWVLSAVLPPPPPLFSFVFPEAFSLIIRKKSTTTRS